MNRILFSALAGTLLLSACDSDPTGTDAPDLIGSYSVQQSATVASAGIGTFNFECAGTLTIDEQSGGSFSGTIATAVASSCGATSADFEGTVSGGGNITLGTETVEAIEELAEEAGCTIVSIGDLTGTFSSGVMTAEADAEADCQTQIGLVRVAIEYNLLARRI